MQFHTGQLPRTTPTKRLTCPPCPAHCQVCHARPFRLHRRLARLLGRSLYRCLQSHFSLAPLTLPPPSPLPPIPWPMQSPLLLPPPIPLPIPPPLIPLPLPLPPTPRRRCERNLTPLPLLCPFRSLSHSVLLGEQRLWPICRNLILEVPAGQPPSAGKGRCTLINSHELHLPSAQALQLLTDKLGVDARIGKTRALHERRVDVLPLALEAEELGDLGLLSALPSSRQLTYLETRVGCGRVDFGGDTPLLLVARRPRCEAEDLVVCHPCELVL